MKRTSSARASTGFGWYFSSVILNSVFRKLPVKLSSLSGELYGRPMLWRYAYAAMLGTFAINRWVCRRRELLSNICFASGFNVDSAPTVLRKIPIGWAS